MVAAEHIEQVEHALPRLLGGLTLLLHHREEQFQGIGGSPHGSETASRLQPHLLGGTGLPGLVDQGFDVLAVVLFQQDYQVLKAALIPHARVVELAKRVERTNSWRVLLRDNVWSVPDVCDVTEDLQKAESAWADMLVKEPART